MRATFRKRSRAWKVGIKRKGFGRISRTFDTRANAEAWARKVEGEMGIGVFVSRKESENTTLSEALDRYEKEIVAGKKGSRQERNRIESWKPYPLAKRFLATIQGKDIAAWRDARLKEAGPNTVRLELAVISHHSVFHDRCHGMGEGRPRQSRPADPKTKAPPGKGLFFFRK